MRPATNTRRQEGRKHRIATSAATNDAATALRKAAEIRDKRRKRQGGKVSPARRRSTGAGAHRTARGPATARRRHGQAHRKHTLRWSDERQSTEQATSRSSSSSEQGTNAFKAKTADEARANSVSRGSRKRHTESQTQPVLGPRRQRRRRDTCRSHSHTHIAFTHKRESEADAVSCGGAGGLVGRDEMQQTRMGSSSAGRQAGTAANEITNEPKR